MPDGLIGQRALAIVITLTAMALAAAIVDITVTTITSAKLVAMKWAGIDGMDGMRTGASGKEKSAIGRPGTEKARMKKTRKADGPIPRAKVERKMKMKDPGEGGGTDHGLDPKRDLRGTEGRGNARGVLVRLRKKRRGDTDVGEKGITGVVVRGALQALAVSAPFPRKMIIGRCPRALVGEGPDQPEIIRRRVIPPVLFLIPHYPEENENVTSVLVTGNDAILEHHRVIPMIPMMMDSLEALGTIPKEISGDRTLPSRPGAGARQIAKNPHPNLMDTTPVAPCLSPALRHPLLDLSRPCTFHPRWTSTLMSRMIPGLTLRLSAYRKCPHQD